MNIYTGDLREIVRIQAPTVTRDPAGGEKRVYNEILETYAKYLPAGGTEEDMANKITLREKTEFIIRNTGTEITNDCRLTHRGVTWEILSVSELTLQGTFSANRFLRIKVELFK